MEIPESVQTCRCDELSHHFVRLSGLVGHPGPIRLPGVVQASGCDMVPHSVNVFDLAELLGLARLSDVGNLVGTAGWVLYSRKTRLCCPQHHAFLRS